MAWNQHRHETHNRIEKARTYSYAKFGKETTEKQYQYAKDMVAMCEDRGIDLSFAHLKFGTKQECNRAINTAYTMLKKNGYDGHGNKMKGEKV